MLGAWVAVSYCGLSSNIRCTGFCFTWTLAKARSGQLSTLWFTDFTTKWEVVRIFNLVSSIHFSFCFTTFSTFCSFQVPFDGSRLVFPPVPAAVLATIFYQPVHLVNSLFGGDLYHPKLVLSGSIIGYVCYDMIHFYIHHGSPKNNIFYHLKRYHYNHHFINHDKGFGISSPLWDFVFSTKIVLKKLKYLLKW